MLFSSELAAASVESHYGIMSSFRPANNAKLYASPEDMKNVGYRSRSLPSQPNNRILRKSHSLRASNTTFMPVQGQPITNSQVNGGGQGNNNNNNDNNQYAQPLKTIRSNSIAGIRERKKRTSSISSASTIPSTPGGNPNAPPIPEPDYSLSESENEIDEEESEEECVDPEIAKQLEKAAAREKLESSKETSGNSNTSGSSSTGSSSMPHSFSVDEIQKVLIIII